MGRVLRGHLMRARAIAGPHLLTSMFPLIKDLAPRAHLMRAAITVAQARRVAMCLRITARAPRVLLMPALVIAASELLACCLLAGRGSA